MAEGSHLKCWGGVGPDVPAKELAETADYLRRELEDPEWWRGCETPDGFVKRFGPMGVAMAKIVRAVGKAERQDGNGQCYYYMSFKEGNVEANYVFASSVLGVRLPDGDMVLPSNQVFGGKPVFGVCRGGAEWEDLSVDNTFLMGDMIIWAVREILEHAGLDSKYSR